MSLTTAVKDEVLGLPDAAPSTRLVELTTLLRFGGGLHVVGGKLAVEIELDHAGAAQRARQLAHALLGVQSTAKTVPANSNRKFETIRVLFTNGADQLALHTGLVDTRRRPVRGLPNKVTTAPIGDLVGVLRGAFLARGVVSDPGRSQIIEIAAPTNEAAMALVGACNRCGISAKTRDVRGGFRVVIRDADAISSFLTYMGAATSLDKWSEARATREVRANANRLVNFDDANLRRSAQAAVAAPLTTHVHLTGGQGAFDSIVWGGRDPHAAGAEPLLTKPITCELGNVTPWIIVPGRYTPAQLACQADTVAA